MSDNAAATTVTLMMGITDYAYDAQGLAMSTDHLTRVRLPEQFAAEDIARMRTDFELLAKAMRDHPSEMALLLGAHCSKDAAVSRRIADELGLSEDNFKAQGGGIIWGVVAAAVLCDVLTACLTGWTFGTPLDPSA
ncbi:hypothetical protein ACFVYA_36225 [Amycolatopsis sp. NPDC058278]|uniref:hypothetical protein n=1 Tax=Amycolatopsis sp. NPDC058278 TaxID=3346417 RepID=UPI0036DC01CB